MEVSVGFITMCMLTAVNVYAYYFLTLEPRKGVNCNNWTNLKKTISIYLNPFINLFKCLEMKHLKC